MAKITTIAKRKLYKHTFPSCTNILLVDHSNSEDSIEGRAQDDECPKQTFRELEEIRNTETFQFPDIGVHLKGFRKGCQIDLQLTSFGATSVLCQNKIKMEVAAIIFT